MSVEDDTFEIDLYGDDPIDLKAEPQSESKGDGHEDIAQELSGVDGGNDQANTEIFDQTSAPTQPSDTRQEAADTTVPNASTPQQGTKRKASDAEQEHHQPDASHEQSYTDNRPLDPGASPCLKLADLHWWTTEEDLRGMCARAGAEAELHELSFGEHKINGKSKGEAYLEFATAQAATAVKRTIEVAAQVKEEGSGVRKAPFVVYFAPVGNPFRTGVGAVGKKEFAQNLSLIHI